MPLEPIPLEPGQPPDPTLEAELNELRRTDPVLKRIQETYVLRINKRLHFLANLLRRQRHIRNRKAFMTKCAQLGVPVCSHETYRWDGNSVYLNMTESFLRLDDQPWFDKCVHAIFKYRKAATRMFIDTVGLDSHRAVRVAKEMERLGLIGPYQTGFPRKIFWDKLNSLNANQTNQINQNLCESISLPDKLNGTSNT